MNSIRQILGFATVILLGALVGAGGYESVVMAPNYAADIPNSLEHARLFMRATNPGNFFRVLAPGTQLALLVSVIIFWRIRPSRWWYVAALVLLLSVDVITFTFHYPRNELLFHSPMTQPVAQLTAAAHEWATGNVFRIGLLLASAIAASIGLRSALVRVRDSSSA